MSDLTIRKRTVGNASEEKKHGEISPEFKYHHEELPAGDSLAMKIYSRMLVFISLMVVVYFSFKEEKFITFARQTDTLPGKGEIVECSPEYWKEVDKYEGCSPKECKRFVTDQVVSRDEAEKILKIFMKLTSKMTKYPVRISDIAKELASPSQKENKSGILDENDKNIYNEVKEKIKQSLFHHFGVDPSKIYYLAGETYFSTMTAASPASSSSLNEYDKSVTEEESKKGIHYTSLLYLGDYNKDFKGGRFVFVDSNVNKTVEPKKGRINMFTSGKENSNYIEKVTSGIRYAIAYSFSCDENNAVDKNNV